MNASTCRRFRPEVIIQLRISSCTVYTSDAGVAVHSEHTHGHRKLYVSAYVFVVDALHEHQLSVRSFGMGLVLKGSTELLDSDVPLQDVVICRAIGEEKQHCV